MNEISSAFRPNQVSLGLEVTIRIVELEGAVLRQSLTSVIRIKEELTGLRILDTHLAEEDVQVVPRHVQLLADLGDGEAGDGIKHMVGIIGTRLETGNQFVASLEGGLHDLERSCHDHLVALVWVYHHITSLLADAWEHFARYPMLEAFGAVELGGEDEGIEAGFVDVNHALNSACCRGVTFRDILCFYMFS